jgi:alpha-L-arabinofuranosidase
MKVIKFLLQQRSLFFLFMAIFVLNGFGENAVTFDVTKAEAVVAHEVFGLLMERLGRQWGGQGSIFVGTNSSVPNTNGMRNDVIEGFKECGIGACQWPGGCAANGYNWNANKNPSNDVGVDRFIEFCKLTGAEAFIVGKPTANDAASNAAFAKYIIEDLDYPLKWFKVGNEIWGGCGTSYTNGYTSSSFPANYERLKELRNTENGKNLHIVAAANASEGNYNWISGYYSSIGDMMDAIEYHDYVYHPDDISSSNFTDANYWTVMNQTFSGDVHAHLNTIYNSMVSADPEKKVKIDLDEWGNWLQDLGDGWMQQATVMDAVGAGGHLNQFIQKADLVEVAALAQGVNVIQSVININQSGQMVKTPTFYVFKMFKPHHANNAKSLPMSNHTFENANGNTPSGNAAATVDDSGIVNISITNCDLSVERTVVVTLTSNVDEYVVKSAEVVTGPQKNSANDFGKDEVVNIKTLDESNYTLEGKKLTVKMPTKSVVMVRLMPPVTALQQGIMMKNTTGGFSVRTEANGKIRISSSVTGKTPVTISLYSIDGRVMIDKTSSTFDAGNNTYIFDKVTGRGVYLVTITGAGLNVSKQIAVAR